MRICVAAIMAALLSYPAVAGEIRPATDEEMTLVRSAMEIAIRDEPSARYRGVLVTPYGKDNSLAVCGLVNAKSEFGAYAGFNVFSGFIADNSQTKARAAYILIVDNRDLQLDLAEKACAKDGIAFQMMMQEPAKP